MDGCLISMRIMLPSKFNFDWVLIDELAVGPAPRKQHHVELLVSAGITGIMSLCSQDEVPQPEIPANKIQHRRIILPDHSYGREPTVNEINSTLRELKQLKSIGPVFVHCKAGIERSPLICIAWLAMEKNLSIQSALDYLMRVHPGTNPLASHLMIIEELLAKKTN